MLFPRNFVGKPYLVEDCFLLLAEPSSSSLSLLEVWRLLSKLSTVSKLLLSSISFMALVTVVSREASCSFLAPMMEMWCFECSVEWWTCACTSCSLSAAAFLESVASRLAEAPLTSRAVSRFSFQWLSSSDLKINPLQEVTFFFLLSNNDYQNQ